MSIPKERRMRSSFASKPSLGLLQGMGGAVVDLLLVAGIKSLE
jgi:hypothetical protein